MRELFKDIARDFTNLRTLDTLHVLAIGGAGAAVARSTDEDVNHHLAGDGWKEAAFDAGKIAGYGLVQGGLAGLTYAWGRLDRAPKIAHLGVDLLRAQIVTSALTYGLKGAVRRQRPDASGGFSFPSGHSSVTFASATVLQRHFGWKGALAYSVSSYVAASRLHENRHYLSDVVFGAAVGVIAGRTVTRHGRDNFAVALVPTRKGTMVAFVMTDRSR